MEEDCRLAEISSQLLNKKTEESSSFSETQPKSFLLDGPRTSSSELARLLVAGGQHGESASLNRLNLSETIALQDEQSQHSRNLSEFFFPPRQPLKNLLSRDEDGIGKKELNKGKEEVANGGRKFRCNLCKFSCLTHGGLYLHKNAVHLGIRFRCDKCSYEGTQEVNLKRHIESKHGNVLHSCKLCNVQTRVSYYAENHLKKKHGILDRDQFANYLERKEILPRDAEMMKSEEEKQLEDEMENEDERESCEEGDGNYLDPNELLEQRDLINDEAETSSSSVRRSIEITTETEENSVPDLELVEHAASSKGSKTDRDGEGQMRHKSPQFQCKKCDYIAQSSGTLTRHVSVVHKGVRWSCRLCGYVTTVKCSMVRHVQSIHQGWRYKCSFCNHESTQKGGLKYHIEKKHPGQLPLPRWSSLAPVKTKGSSQIPGIEDMDVNQMYDELSDATPTPQEIYIDSVQKQDLSPKNGAEGFAQKNFARNKEISRDSESMYIEPRIEIKQEHTPEDTSTEAPGQYVGEDYDFTELYSRFTGYEDVSCDLCTYSTSRMGNMRRHVLAVHQGVRFPCNLCSYRAPDKGSLLRHTRGVHEGIRFFCDFCPYSATQKGNLKKHQEQKHGENTYDCMYCDFKVNWKGSFIKHLQTQHGDLMAMQGLGTTGETNPLLSFNSSSFAQKPKEPESWKEEEGEEDEDEEEEEEEEEEVDPLDKTEDRDSSIPWLGDDSDPDHYNNSAEMNLIKSQNMSPTDKELEGSKIVIKTDTSPGQLKFKVEVNGGEEDLSDENGTSCSFQCSMCKYTANSSASLARHNGAVHKGIRWQCKDCDFITRDKSSLKRHRRNRHEGIRFKCNYCDYDAGQKGNIKSHMDRKHPEIPYDHTEFQEVKVEKSKYTREAKHDKEPAEIGVDPLTVTPPQMPGFLGLGWASGLNTFSAHILSSLIQAKKMSEENNAFHSTDEDSNFLSSDKEEDQTDQDKEEDINDGQEEEEDDNGSFNAQSHFSEQLGPVSPAVSPGPSLTSTPVKNNSSLLLSALRSFQCSSSSPTLTPRKSLLDLLNINQDIFKDEEEKEEAKPEVTITVKPLKEQGTRTRKPQPEMDSSGNLPCQECTFVARSQGTLFRHVQSVHRGVRFSCDYCDFVTIDKGSLKRHVNGQHKGLKHKCDFCDYENAQIGNVKKHIQTKHANIVYHCPYCSLEAKHKWYLEQHVRKLHTDKLFVFDINNIAPKVATTNPPSLPAIQQHVAPPVNPGVLENLLPNPGLLLLHPMAKFFVPEALKKAQANLEVDTAANHLELHNDEAETANDTE